MSTLLRTIQIEARRAAIRSEPDPDITRRLSVLPEERVLEYFWLMLRQGAERLWLLLQFTEVVIARPPSWNAAAIREAHEQRSDHATIVLDRRRCFACDAGEMLYRHHIVEVHHGGSNAVRNQVPLCFSCHQYLHPWLKDEPQRQSVAGLESLGNVIARTCVEPPA